MGHQIDTTIVEENTGDVILDNVSLVIYVNTGDHNDKVTEDHKMYDTNSSMVNSRRLVQS